jgi:hypothetical protein
VNTEKTEDILMVHHQNSRQNYEVQVNVIIDSKAQNPSNAYSNRSLKNMTEFRYLEMAVANQNCIHIEIENRLNLRNSSHSAIQNLSSCHSFKYVNIKIY